MTLEEGLIALLAMVAGILLFVGLAQALDARPPRRRRRRSVSGADASATLAPAPPTPVVTELAPRAPYTGPERRRSPRPGSRQRVRAAAPEVPPSIAPAPVETAAPPPGGLGLRNTAERLRQMYGADARLSLTSRDTGGTIAELELPYRVRDAAGAPPA